MKFFWRKRNSSSKKKNDEIISQILEKVEERRELLNKIKSSYNPKNDERESRVWYFMKSNPELNKLSIQYLKSYQENYNVKLPEIVIRILNEIGSGRLLNHNFLGSEGQLQEPLYCFETDFLQSCLDNGVNPKLLEDEMLDLYDMKKNCFNNPQIQSIYEESNSNRDENIIILFPLGGHSSYLTLNREKNEELAVFNISGICNKSITIDNYEYDFPYFQYTDGTIQSSILQNINTDYWKNILKEIVEMNKK